MLTNKDLFNIVNQQAHLTWIHKADIELTERATWGHSDVTVNGVPESVVDKVAATFESRGFLVHIARSGHLCSVLIRANPGK